MTSSGDQMLETHKGRLKASENNLMIIQGQDFMTD